MEEGMLDTLLDIAIDFARKVMVGGKAEIAPVFVAITKNKKIHIIQTPWGSTEEKIMTREALKHDFQEKGVVLYSHVCEAWMAHRPDYKPGDLPASQDPNRVECVTSFATDGKETKYRFYYTIRDANGNCTELREDKGEPGITVGMWENLMGGSH